MFDINAYKNDLAHMSISELKREVDYLISRIASPDEEWETRWTAVWVELDIRNSVH